MLPIRSNSRSWSTRSNVICVSAGRSPISSRNSVPPSAASKRPIRRSRAPVKAPFSCPKSSDATSADGIAAQFTRMNAREDRGDRLWIALAISSFPVPVSPRINTVESVAATLSTAFSTFRRDCEEPTISSNIREWSNSSRRAMFSFRVRSSFLFRSSMSVPVAYQRTMRPCSS